jgi:hypothetical protein
VNGAAICKKSWSQSVSPCKFVLITLKRIIEHHVPVCDLAKLIYIKVDDWSWILSRWCPRVLYGSNLGRWNRENNLLLESPDIS